MIVNEKFYLLVKNKRFIGLRETIIYKNDIRNHSTYFFNRRVKQGVWFLDFNIKSFNENTQKQ